MKGFPRQVPWDFCNSSAVDILSIDSIYYQLIECVVEVIFIKLSIQSKEKEVIRFLDALKNILESEEFNINKDLTVIKSKKKAEDEKFSTVYTLLDLGYDNKDIVERLMELTVSEYSETLVDKDNIEPPLLFVFGKDINGKLIYIKLKIRGKQAGHVLCVSFHYAKEAMIFPYA